MRKWQILKKINRTLAESCNSSEYPNILESSITDTVYLPLNETWQIWEIPNILLENNNTSVSSLNNVTSLDNKGTFEKLSKNFPYNSLGNSVRSSENEENFESKALGNFHEKADELIIRQCCMSSQR